MGWRRCEGDDDIDVVSMWRGNGGGYLLAILLFHKNSIQLYKVIHFLYLLCLDS
jgi:hypothetical protein